MTEKTSYMDTDDQEKIFTSGIIFDILPTIQGNEKDVLLAVHFQLSEILSWETLEQNGRKYEVPTTQTATIETNVIVENQRTVLLGGLKMAVSEKEKKERSKLPVIGLGQFKRGPKITDKKILLVLIKPTIIIQHEVPSEPAIGALAPRGMGGGMMGGSSGNN